MSLNSEGWILGAMLDEPVAVSIQAVYNFFLGWGFYSFGAIGLQTVAR